MMSTASGTSEFVNGQNIPVMNRTASLLAPTGYIETATLLEDAQSTMILASL
jgi:hypothetical protein